MAAREQAAPSATSAASPKLLRAVQACRRQVAGLGQDDAWRDFLGRHVGKASLREMTGRELGAVLDALHKAGAPRRPGAGAGQPQLDDRPQVRMARALWIELADMGAVRNRSEQAMEQFGRRCTGKPRLSWCRAADLNKLVEALKDWRDRETARDPVVRCAATMEVPEEWTRERALVRALWQALIDAGAMRNGIHALLSTWLLREGYSSGNPYYLTLVEADRAVVQLGEWLRQVVRKQRQEAARDAGL